MRVLLLHGWGGKHELHWLTWLYHELKKRKIEVYYPDLPNPSLPERDEWLNSIENELDFKNSEQDLIIFGHSLGCPTALLLLEKHKARRAVLVSGFANDLGIPEIASFTKKEFNWKKIKQNCNEFICINSDDDPFIDLSIAKDLAKKLNTKLIIEHNASHIFAPMHGPYPRLLGYIKE